MVTHCMALVGAIPLCPGFLGFVLTARQAVTHIHEQLGCCAKAHVSDGEGSAHTVAL